MLGEDMATAHEELLMATEYWDEDCGEQLNLADAESGMKRGQQLLMENLNEVPRVDVPRDARKGTGRWRLRKKAGGVRSRYVIHQYAAEAWNEDAFSGTPGWVFVRVLLTIAHLQMLEAVIGVFNVAFMHTPLDEKGRIHVEPPRE